MNNSAKIIHGYNRRGNRHPLHVLLYAIKRRCKHDGHYVRHGIQVCPEWSAFPGTFVDWGIANGWKPGLTIDRIDNKKGYAPENCRFVTHKENCNNRDNNVKLLYKGEMVRMGYLLEHYGIPGLTSDTLRARLARGLSVEEALSRPVGSYKKVQHQTNLD